MLSLLPAYPKFFNGRDRELKAIVSTILFQPARIAILGTGGIGKTTLATAVIHHPDIMSEFFEQRHFISCESAGNANQLKNLAGRHLGLELSGKLLNKIVKYLSDHGPVILVLDNLETSWEGTETRQAVEEFLSALTDVSQLTLLVSLVF